ncbi:MAG: hypothetical protein C0424_05090 [Sphingobacteriaceae bacterium]|nr:hypothetical protein [Sphingobacteriaceae bacterium]
MKKILFATALLIYTVVAQAQPGGMPPAARQEQMKAAKIGFLTRELNLNEEEAQRFWPVYNKFDNERESHRRKMVALRLEVNDTDEQLTAKDAEAAIEQYLQLRQEEVDMEKKFYQAVKKVLPPEKVALLLQAEKRFQRELLRNLQQRREEKPPFRGR